MGCGSDGGIGLGRGYGSGRRPNRIVSSRLELIGGAKEGNELPTNARFGVGQSGKLSSNAPVCSCDLATLLEDVGLGGVEDPAVGFARCNMGQRQHSDIFCIGKRGTGLSQDSRQFRPS